MYLKSATVEKDFRGFVKGTDFPLKPITLLVGDQGCGKSTFLLALAQQSPEPWLSWKLTPAGKAGVSSYYFDSEKMNPRVLNPLTYSTPSGISTGIGVGAAVQSRYLSHGEVLQQFTVDGVSRAENAVLLFDEPESGLSLRNQFALWNAMEEAETRHCQLIVATHSLVLIQSVPEVLSLEHGRWMTSQEFVESNKQPPLS